MNKHITMLIESDPRTSHRTCEGLRIALGLVSSGYRLQLILLGPALMLLQDERHDFVDEDGLEQYLPLLLESIPTFFVLEPPSEIKLGQKPLLYQNKMRILPPKLLQPSLSKGDVFFVF